MKEHHKQTVKLLTTMLEAAKLQFESAEDRYDVIQGIDVMRLNLQVIETVISHPSAGAAVLSHLDQLTKDTEDRIARHKKERGIL